MATLALAGFIWDFVDSHPREDIVDFPPGSRILEPMSIADSSGGLISPLNSQRTTFIFFGLLTLIIISLVGLTWANYRFAQMNPGGNDFFGKTIFWFYF